MNAITSNLSGIKLTQVAFGIRFKNRFSIEDSLGDIVDDILNTDLYGPERFTQIQYGANSRQLTNDQQSERIALTRSDCIFDSKAPDYGLSEIPAMADSYANIIWGAVQSNVRKPPNITRYGCLIGFELGSEWDPIERLLNVESFETSDFHMQYSKRVALDEALIKKGVNDYGRIVYTITRSKGITSAALDYQQYFEPELDSKESRNRNLFEGFVGKAIKQFNIEGWPFLRSRLELMDKAA